MCRSMKQCSYKRFQSFPNEEMAATAAPVSFVRKPEYIKISFYIFTFIFHGSTIVFKYQSVCKHKLSEPVTVVLI